MMGNVQIEIESPMQLALRSGVDAYQPVFRGEPLAVEASDADVSLKNLRQLLAAGLTVCGIEVGEKSNVLVTFRGGESYLATGFSVGNRGLSTILLAQFASEAELGKPADWKTYLVKYLPEEFVGPLQIPPPTASGPRMFDPS